MCNNDKNDFGYFGYGLTGYVQYMESFKENNPTTNDDDINDDDYIDDSSTDDTQDDYTESVSLTEEDFTNENKCDTENKPLNANYSADITFGDIVIIVVALFILGVAIVNFFM